MTLIFIFLVHSAKRVLQQLYANSCKSCGHSENVSAVTDREINIGIRLDQIHSTSTSKISSESAAIAAAEIVSPEEALPEEMIPDQEAPSVLPDTVAKIESQQDSHIASVSDHLSQQLEDAQQQSVNEHSALSNDNLSLNSGDQSVLGNSQADNMSRTLLNIEANKLSKPALARSKLRTAKIESSQIDSFKRPLIQYEKPIQLTNIQSKTTEVENPPITTRLLYQFGHILPPKDVCPKQGEGLKLSNAFLNF